MAAGWMGEYDGPQVESSRQEIPGSALEGVQHARVLLAIAFLLGLIAAQSLRAQAVAPTPAPSESLPVHVEESPVSGLVP